MKLNIKVSESILKVNLFCDICLNFYHLISPVETIFLLFYYKAILGINF